MKSIDLLAAHMIGDYILQTNEEAVNKFTDFNQLFSHCIKYTMAFIPFLIVDKSSMDRKMLFGYLMLATHLLTDRRRWASGEEWPPKPILVDQAIHAATLALLNRILKED